MVAGHINNEDSLDFRADRAFVGGVSEVDDMTEAFEGSFLKESAIPRLGMRSVRVSMEQNT